jgi:hypothetical protein
VGNRLDLVRLAAGPDPGLPHFPDFGGVSRQVRLPGNHAPASRQDIRIERDRPYKISAEEVKKRARGDRIARERLAYLENPEPHYLTHGPKTRREFLNLVRWNGGSRA